MSFFSNVQIDQLLLSKQIEVAGSCRTEYSSGRKGSTILSRNNVAEKKDLRLRNANYRGYAEEEEEEEETEADRDTAEEEGEEGETEDGTNESRCVCMMGLKPALT